MQHGYCSFSCCICTSCICHTGLNIDHYVHVHCENVSKSRTTKVVIDLIPLGHRHIAEVSNLVHIFCSHWCFAYIMNHCRKLHEQYGNRDVGFLGRYRVIFCRMEGDGRHLFCPYLLNHQLTQKHLDEPIAIHLRGNICFVFFFFRELSLSIPGGRVLKEMTVRSTGRWTELQPWWAAHGRPVETVCSWQHKAQGWYSCWARWGFYRTCTEPVGHDYVCRLCWLTDRGQSKTQNTGKQLNTCVSHASFPYHLRRLCSGTRRLHVWVKVRFRWYQGDTWLLIQLWQSCE